MSSANWSASSRYCVVRMIVVPSRVRSRKVSHRSLRPRGSRPVVGSSRNSTDGWETRLAARSRRRRIPPDRSFASLSAASAKSTRSSRSSAWRRASLLVRPWSLPTITRLARDVSRPSTVACWAATPMVRRTASASRTTSWPATEAVPSVGSARVVRILMAVVLPAPLCPSNPRTRAGLDVQIQVPECPQVAVAFPQILDVHGRHGPARPVPPAQNDPGPRCSYSVPLGRT